MDKKMIIALTLVSLLVLSIIISVYMNKTIDLKFEKIATYNVDVTTEKPKRVWISILSEKYKPFFSSEYVFDNYGIDINSNIDTDKYSYIVTFGHELKQISYCNSFCMSKYLGILPKERIGMVVLSKESTGKVYVYRVKKINIVCDYHSKGENEGKEVVVFK